MEEELLKIFKNELSNYNYEYDEYTGSLVYPYITGEFNETNNSFENNTTNGEMILTLWNRGSRKDLMDIKKEIKNKFADYRADRESGTVFISYRNALFIRSGEAELKKMEIYLDIILMEGE